LQAFLTEMSIDNRNLIITLRYVLLFLISLIPLDFLLSQVPGRISSYFANHTMAIVSFILILILFILRIKYFYFEAEYEIIHLRQRPLMFDYMTLLNSYGYSRYEFPKRLLKDVYVENFLWFKTLVFVVETTGGKLKERTIDVTYISGKKLDEVLRIMRSIIQKNKMQ
jgi:predicted neutral ceramidase superfamily lipid hydrolase